MDRLDTLAVFIAVAEHGSFIAAAQRLGRSPAAVTRAVAALEDRLGTRLLNRTTRVVALTDAGARYLDLCRRLLSEFEEFEASAAGEQLEARGILTVTAPTMFGRLHVVPIVRAFMRDHPSVNVNLVLLDRMVAFIDEGIDVGIRIGHLPDSSLRAVHVGGVRRVVCASPAYLAEHGVPETPHALAQHTVISVTGVSHTPDRWTFGGSGAGMAVPVSPRLVVNLVDVAVDVAVRGGGLVRLLSYQSAPLEAAGALQRVLRAYEPPPVPVHIVHPAGRYLSLKVRRFIDTATLTLRKTFAQGTVLEHTAAGLPSER